jgi:hypothetical protein
MLKLEDDNQMGDDIQPADDDAQQAPQADEEIIGSEEVAEEGIAEEKTEEDVEGGAEETNI